MRTINLATGTGVEASGGLEEVPPLPRVYVELVRRANGSGLSDPHWLNGGAPAPRPMSLRDGLAKVQLEEAYPGIARWSKKQDR